MDWLLAPQTLPFGVALGLLLLITLIEGVGMLLATSPGSVLDSLLPDDFSEGVLGWLHLGKVPSLVLLVLFLLGFSLAGYILQLMAQSLWGDYLPTVLAVVLVLPVGLLTMRVFGGLLGQVIPNDETSVVSEQSLLGLVGVISQGIAKAGLAAQARVRDKHGRTHYLLVEPDISDEQFDEGTQVLIISKNGAIWRCIRNPHPELLS